MLENLRSEGATLKLGEDSWRTIVPRVLTRSATSKDSFDLICLNLSIARLMVNDAKLQTGRRHRWLLRLLGRRQSVPPGGSVLPVAQKRRTEAVNASTAASAFAACLSSLQRGVGLRGRCGRGTPPCRGCATPAWSAAASLRLFTTTNSADNVSCPTTC